MASTKQVLAIIKGQSHFGYGPSQGLAAYHAAKSVVNANRRIGVQRRAAAMRKALKSFNVMISFDPSINGRIRLYAPATKSEMFFE